MATPQEIQKLLQELQRAYNKLGSEENPFSAEKFDTSNIENARVIVEQLEVALEGVYARIEASKSSFKDLNETLKNIAKELNPNVFNASKEIEGGFKKIVKEAQKLYYEEEGISKLSLKQLTSLKERITQQQLETKNSSERLLKEQGFGEENLKNIKYITRQSQLYKGLNEAGKTAFEYLKDSNSVVNTILDKTNQRISQEKILNKSLGLGGAIIGGIEQSLKKLGLSGLASQLGIEEAKEKMKETANEITKGGTEVAGLSGKFKILKSGIGSMGKSLLTNLKDPLSISLFLINELISALQGTDKQTGELAKSFGTSYSEAALLRNELNDVANLSGDININTAALQRSLIAINKEFGTSTLLNGELLEDFTQITEVAGITNETALKLSKITVATGGDLSDNTSLILGQAVAFNAVNGLALNEKEILEGVSKLSNATVLSLGMQPKELLKAVAQAKALGVELSTLEAISSSLLQFESSIENELAAELLIGRDLNLEKARTLALNGNIAGVAEEIAKQIGSAEDFTNMNVIQQEALAKAVGMTRDQLAGSLIERKALAAIGEGDKTALEAYNRLKKEGLSDDAIAARLGDEKLAANLKSQSVQDRFNKSVEKLREIFVSLAEPILQVVSPIVDLLVPAISAISFILTPVFDMFKGISKILTGDFETLTGWELAMGAIGAAALLYLGYTKSIAIYNGIIKGHKIAQVALERANKAGILSTIGSLIVQLGIQMGILSASLAANAAVTFGVGVAIAVAAAAAGYAAIKAMTADDMFSPGENTAGYGKRTLFGPEGTIALNDKDTVIAGTNLFKGDNNIDPLSSTSDNNINPTSPTKSSSTQDNSALIAEIRALT
jgi:hypothetical protein